MPFANPEDHRRWREEWKKRTRENGYNKWLYARRKLRFEDAVEFRKALETICEIGETRDVEIAESALKASDRRHAKVGSHPNGKTPQEETGDTLLEALAKLGLT